MSDPVRSDLRHEAQQHLDLRGGFRPADVSTANVLDTAARNAFGRLQRCVRRYARSDVAAFPLCLIAEPTLQRQWYRLVVSADGGVQIYACDATGHRNGLHAVARHVQDGDGLVPVGEWLDGPVVGIRGVCIDAGRRYWQLERLESLLDELAWLGINRLQLHLTEWNAFRIRLSDPRFARIAAEQCYSSAQLNELIEIAHADGIEVSVELNLPAHCSALIAAVPELDVCDRDSVLRDGSTWTGSPTQAWMIDITRPENVEFCASLVGALVTEVHADAFHLGGDEWFDAARLARAPGLVAAAAELTTERAANHPGAPACAPADVVVDFLNRMCAVVQAAGARAELWSWWHEAGARALSPDEQITITAWGTPESASRLALDGHRVIASPEHSHYVTPRTAPGNLPDVNYVTVDCAHLLTLPLAPVEGEQLAIWCDWAEEQNDDYFIWYATRPLQAFAERVWRGPVPDGAAARQVAAAHDRHHAPIGARTVSGSEVRIGRDEHITAVRIDATGGAPVRSENGQWTPVSAKILDSWRGTLVELADRSGAWHTAIHLDWQLPPTPVTLPLPLTGARRGRVSHADGAHATDGHVEWLVVPARGDNDA